MKSQSQVFRVSGLDASLLCVLFPRNTRNSYTSYSPYIRNFQLQFVPKRERSNSAPGLQASVRPLVYQKNVSGKELPQRQQTNIFKSLNMNGGAPQIALKK